MPFTYHRPGQICIEHTFDVPLDHHDQHSPRIDIFAREIVATSNAGKDLPALLYLQGGPGCAADRPPSAGGWLAQALSAYRVILLDQRGTGRSTPVSRQTLDGVPAVDAASYLRHFRADAIVRDTEVVRSQLVGDRPWTVLGQSFGGFCALTYLSLAPHALSAVLIASGLPSLSATADDVYRAAYPRALAHNNRFFGRYPNDRKQARQVIDHLSTHDTRMPSGEILTPQRFQTAGIAFGAAGTFDTLHHLLEQAFVSTRNGTVISDAFLHGLDSLISVAERPLYALLHESIYCQGFASAWAAHRVRHEFPQFDVDQGGDVNFTAEMFYPWLFEQDPVLTPLRETAELLAAYDDWPQLYDLGQLAANTVPVAAAIFTNDLYVDLTHSQQTAQHIGRLNPWITSEFSHDALRTHPQVFERLLAMSKGDI